MKGRAIANEQKNLRHWAVHTHGPKITLRTQKAEGALFAPFLFPLMYT